MPQPIASACAAGDKVYVLNRQFEEVLDVPWNKAALYAEVCSFIMPTTPGAEVYLGTFSKYGDGDGELIWPVGIAIDSDENIYIADEWMNRISIFTNSGHFLRNWSTQGDGEFNRTSGIALDLNDDVYVVDSLNHRARKFTKDGEYILQFGSFGDGPGELNAPWGVAVGDEGSVYVADHKNHRVQKFDANGEFVASFGSYGKGKGKGQLNRPSDVAVDPDGDVYVCDWGNDRVQVFASDGRFIASFIGDAQQLAKGHQQQVDANPDVIKARRRAYTLEPEWRFAMPTGVTFDVEKSRLIVADSQRSRVQIYNKVKNYMEPQFNL